MKASKCKKSLMQRLTLVNNKSLKFSKSIWIFPLSKDSSPLQKVCKRDYGSLRSLWECSDKREDTWLIQGWPRSRLILTWKRKIFWVWRHCWGSWCSNFKDNSCELCLRVCLLLHIYHCQINTRYDNAHESSGFRISRIAESLDLYWRVLQRW